MSLRKVLRLEYEAYEPMAIKDRHRLVGSLGLDLPPLGSVVHGGWFHKVKKGYSKKKGKGKGKVKSQKPVGFLEDLEVFFLHPWPY